MTFYIVLLLFLLVCAIGFKLIHIWFDYGQRKNEREYQIWLHNNRQTLQEAQAILEKAKRGK